MKRIILLLAALLATLPAYAIFSAFMVITPENEKFSKIEVKVTEDPKDKAFWLVDITGVTYHDAWLITVDKPLPPEQQEKFREFLWHKKFTVGKIAESKQVWHNPDSSKLPALPTFHVRKDRAARSYIYMDHPIEVCDGGMYYSVDLPAFLPR